MKKYGQITVVLAAFFLLVFIKNARGSDTPAVVGRSSDSRSSSTSQESGLSNSSQSSFHSYKDGTYTGDTEDAYYGNIQISVTISGGRISDVQFLDYPQDNRTSMSINEQAIPILKQEAIQAQSSQVDIVSGASDSSVAFQQSLQSALNKAS